MVLMISLSTLRTCTQRFPFKLASFWWSIILAWRTSQKRLGHEPQIDLFPLSTTKPYPFYLLPLAHDPTMSCIGWVQAGSAWALHMLPFQICPRVCLLLMRLPWPGDSPSAFLDPSCGLFFGFSLHSGARLRMMMDLTFLWPTFDFLYCLPRWTVIPAVKT